LLVQTSVSQQIARVWLDEKNRAAKYNLTVGGFSCYNVAVLRAGTAGPIRACAKSATTNPLHSFSGECSMSDDPIDAERVFSKPVHELETYQQQRARTLANMARLRAERLAREAAARREKP
jgi:hypothetical protein